jgi:alpha-L-fucosidase 2
MDRHSYLKKPVTGVFSFGLGLRLSVIILSLLSFGACSSQANPDELLIPFPEHGFVSRLAASKWEESMLTGNGTIGALVGGNPLNERIILCHEKLFMPEYPPYEAPPLHKYLDKMRELTLNGHGDKAAELLVKAGEEVGIDDMIWTNPLVPACQFEVKSLTDEKVTNYARSVNYETGEAITAWKVGGKTFERTVFFSRADNIGVVKISGSEPGSLNFKLALNQLPIPEGYDEEEEEGSSVDELILEMTHGAEGDMLSYSTTFKKQWENSLKGYRAAAKVLAKGGKMDTEDHWIVVSDADEIVVLIDMKLSYSLPLEEVSNNIEKVSNTSYTTLLDANKKIQSEMFNRFSLNIGSKSKENILPEDLVKRSSFGNLKPELVNRLCEAARYALICSTGELPPALQGIWGGTWRPAWSGDFTQNGNVPSAIACGLNCNFQEVIEAHLDYMWSNMDDFRHNASGLYQAPGIYVPSRSSDSGKAYHYGYDYPHLLWYACGAWTSQFFYDYWLYTGDEEFLKERTIPFMMASMDFYEFILTKDESGKYMFLPSYSPEVGPLDKHQLSINATMDVAALKQLLRNLLMLSDQGWIETDKTATWKDILENLPAYAIDESGDLKEWIWPGLENDNHHRHASHLYPLFYEVDPDFIENPELIDAAKTAIENRLEYRRDRKGAEMAFGLVQKGLAAAHIKDTEHAYECVDWLCNSYWSPALTSYHDPGRIFNVDICGGLPAVVTEMLIQSSAKAVELLPALPKEWSSGSIEGVLCRGQIEIKKLSWDDKQIDVRFVSEKPQNVTISVPGGFKEAEVRGSNSDMVESFAKEGKCVVAVSPGELVEVHFVR